MAITDAEEGGGMRENVKYDDDVIRSPAPVFLNRFSCMKIKLPLGRGEQAEREGLLVGLS